MAGRAGLHPTAEVVGCDHPDPRPAVRQMSQALAARGIRLVLFPVPDKATMQPLQLHGRKPRGGERADRLPAAGNRDFDRFVAEMRAAGVLVFDHESGLSISNHGAHAILGPELEDVHQFSWLEAVR